MHPVRFFGFFFFHHRKRWILRFLTCALLVVVGPSYSRRPPLEPLQSCSCVSIPRCKHVVALVYLWVSPWHQPLIPQKQLNTASSPSSFVWNVCFYYYNTPRAAQQSLHQSLCKCNAFTICTWTSFSQNTERMSARWVVPLVTTALGRDEVYTCTCTGSHPPSHEIKHCSLGSSSQTSKCLSFDDTNETLLLARSQGQTEGSDISTWRKKSCCSMLIAMFFAWLGMLT